MSDQAPATVAIVGLGALGLVAVKNLAEEGFDVTGFDRNPYVGGLWHYTPEDKTSVLPSTVINISKERGCYSDFPYPKDTPSHCSAATVQRYLEDFVEHFNLAPKLRLGTTVTSVRRDEDGQRWELTVQGSSEHLYFDKVIISSGAQIEPFIPKLVDEGLFTGERLHSRAFKRPELFRGKKVLVVGLCNSGVDTAASLRGHADTIYLSYRHGAIVVPRKLHGVPYDHHTTLRNVRFAGFFETYFPNIASRLLDWRMNRLSKSAFQFRPEWRLLPAPPVKHCLPVITDNLIGNLESGVVQPVNGIKRASGPREIEMDDGERIEVDAIVWCTGYQLSFDVLDHEVDPTRNTTPEWAAAKGSKGRPLPRLYKNVFSLDYPDSLAFMGCVTFSNGFFPLSDLASMAVAQVWKGRSKLPSKEEMNRSVDAHHTALCKLARSGSANPLSTKQGEWFHWINDMAGTGLNEKLGWGIEGWLFWFRERRLYKMLVDGLFTPHIFRLFDGKRKRWEGALEEIERVNKTALEMRKLKAA